MKRGVKGMRDDEWGYGRGRHEDEENGSGIVDLRNNGKTRRLVGSESVME